MQTKEQVLQQCTVEGLTVKLPGGQLDRKLYQDVAKSLELIGGKWKGDKIMGFVFPQDPTELLEQIANGDKRNLKKEFQFFATPDVLADRLVNYANLQPNDDILEPSAGQGAIVKAIQRVMGARFPVRGFELMPINQTFLKAINGFVLLGDDFLKEGNGIYDKIIANPPFSKNQDIEHILKMYTQLKKGGRLVTIASKHWQISENRKETEFRDWLTSVGAQIMENAAGEFKESGTNIPTVILIIDKK